MPPPILVFMAPLLLAFEVCQLVLAERYLGKKQIDSGVDPRNEPMHELLACGWVMAIFINWTWMLTMLSTRFGYGQVASMIVVSLLGYALRRSCRVKRVLVILTFEGSIRIGMLVSLVTLAWNAI